MSSDPDGPPELCVQGLYGIGRIDQFPTFGGGGIEGNDLLPGLLPGLDDRLVFPAPGAFG